MVLRIFGKNLFCTQPLFYCHISSYAIYYYLSYKKTSQTYYIIEMRQKVLRSQIYALFCMYKVAWFFNQRQIFTIRINWYTVQILFYKFFKCILKLQ